MSKLSLPFIQTSVEEMIASTAYLELFLRSISEPALLRTFLRFLLLHRHDTHTILDTLVARIGSNSRVWPLPLSWLTWVSHLLSDLCSGRVSLPFFGLCLQQSL